MGIKNYIAILFFFVFFGAASIACNNKAKTTTKESKLATLIEEGKLTTECQAATADAKDKITTPLELGLADLNITKESARIGTDSYGNEETTSVSINVDYSEIGEGKLDDRNMRSNIAPMSVLWKACTINGDVCYNNGNYIKSHNFQIGDIPNLPKGLLSFTILICVDDLSSLEESDRSQATNSCSEESPCYCGSSANILYLHKEEPILTDLEYRAFSIDYHQAQTVFYEIAEDYVSRARDYVNSCEDEDSAAFQYAKNISAYSAAELATLTETHGEALVATMEQVDEELNDELQLMLDGESSEIPCAADIANIIENSEEENIMSIFSDAFAEGAFGEGEDIVSFEGDDYGSSTDYGSENPFTGLKEEAENPEEEPIEEEFRDEDEEEDNSFAEIIDNEEEEEGSFLDEIIDIEDNRSLLIGLGFGVAVTAVSMAILYPSLPEELEEEISNSPESSNDNRALVKGDSTSSKTIRKSMRRITALEELLENDGENKELQRQLAVEELKLDDVINKKIAQSRHRIKKEAKANKSLLNKEEKKFNKRHMETYNEIHHGGSESAKREMDLMRKTRDTLRARQARLDAELNGDVSKIDLLREQEEQAIDEEKKAVDQVIERATIGDAHLANASDSFKTAEADFNKLNSKYSSALQESEKHRIKYKQDKIALKTAKKQLHKKESALSIYHRYRFLPFAAKQRAKYVHYNTNLAALETQVEKKKNDVENNKRLYKENKEKGKSLKKEAKKAKSKMKKEKKVYNSTLEPHLKDTPYLKQAFKRQKTLEKNKKSLNPLSESSSKGGLRGKLDKYQQFKQVLGGSSRPQLSDIDPNIKPNAIDAPKSGGRGIGGVVASLIIGVGAGVAAKYAADELSLSGGSSCGNFFKTAREMESKLYYTSQEVELLEELVYEAKIGTITQEEE